MLKASKFKDLRINLIFSLKYSYCSLKHIFCNLNQVLQNPILHYIALCFDFDWKTIEYGTYYDFIAILLFIANLVVKSNVINFLSLQRVLQ